MDSLVSYCGYGGRQFNTGDLDERSRTGYGNNRDIIPILRIKTGLSCRRIVTGVFQSTFGSIGHAIIGYGIGGIYTGVIAKIA